ncbi:MAG: DUF2309 domain-containing protein [Planctomycetaceae bacterium]|nr:DUF2309 domain-containing protein [Planctomycetaceae bacterium]
MSIPQTQQLLTSDFHDAIESTTQGQLRARKDSTAVIDVVKKVAEKISPVWPLTDYVAVNPYLGFSDQEFLTARQKLRSVSDLETLMPVDYYRELFAAGLLSRADIDAAVDELVADGIEGAERIDVNQVLALLGQPGPGIPTADSEFTTCSNPSRSLRPLSETLDRYTGSHWSRLILEEIAKHCAPHYDCGQAIWSSPWRELPLYLAWRSAAQHDRHFEILGVGAFRKLVKSLPHEAYAALETLLKRLNVPVDLWDDFLLCEALTMPGWSAWVKYQCREADRKGEESSDFAGLLAMRLAYEVALAEQFSFRIDWVSIGKHHQSIVQGDSPPTDEELLRYALLKASEDAYRRQLLNQLAHSHEVIQHEEGVDRPLAQIVFCIDVRSERIRRHLEAVSPQIETFGFAGFFGMPIEFVGLGETAGSSHVPALISPQFRVHEEIDVEDPSATQAAVKRQSQLRFLQKTWKEFQTSAASCFAFVETTGLIYCLGLLLRSLGKGSAWVSRLNAISERDQARLSPSLRGLEHQGVGLTRQAEMAESALRGIGIVKNFGRLIVFCGHGSQTENNPLQAGLDCGACCGHSGEPNARFVAKLLNSKDVRDSLAQNGIQIPQDTHFVPALHNTTTDEIKFFDMHHVPESHLDDLRELQTIVESASQENRHERLDLLPGQTTDDLIRRSRDWSEVRPEWGLAGNAAFIAAPRQLTETVSLGGRSFLHSYDYHEDPEFRVLEQIMTAPLVVANWINMQYYASTVDPLHFGSGNKTLHNVVGRFGVFSGNGGDLMTGLPWQSVHDGQRYQHHPLRLLAVVAAPRDAIDGIICKHELLTNLLTNGWMHLVAHDDGAFYRYTEKCTWDQLTTSSSATIPSGSSKIAG